MFIRAKNLYYGLDFCPAFWDWLVDANITGKVFSIEEVYDELLKTEDELSEWARARTEGFFLAPDATVLPKLAEVGNWAFNQSYTYSAVENFLQVADCHIIARALSGEHTVVTHEIPSASIHRVKIPDACVGLGVKCVTPFEMLRSERARFVLRAAL